MDTFLTYFNENKTDINRLIQFLNNLKHVTYLNFLKEKRFY